MALSLFNVLTLLMALHAVFSPSAPARMQTPPAGPSQRPQDVRLQLETADGNTRFRIGEVIPLKLSFTGGGAKKYQINLATYDRSGRMHYEDFLVEPDVGWSDPLKDYFLGGSSMSGGLTTFDLLSEKPKVIPLDLNEWVRFDRPGEYVLRVVSRRVGPASGSRPYGESAIELRSNALRLTIIPGDRAWQQATLKKAAAPLARTPYGDDVPLSEAREAELRAALKRLRYLGTADAAREMARRLRGEDSRTDLECTFGLIGSPARDVALAEMRRLLADPDHPVSSGFLYVLTVLMRNGGDATLQGRMEEDRRNRESVERELLDAVPQKRGKALALTLTTVLAAEGQGGTKPPHADARLASKLAAVFDLLPTDRQAGILEYGWDFIKSPDFLPVLHRYALRYQEFTEPREVNAYNSLRLSGAALRHWYELNPEEARPVVIKEITRARPRYGADVLGLLPDETLPEAEQALAEHFAAEPESYAAENLASLINRYATAAVLQQVLPVVDEHVGKWACAVQSPVLAYLLRVDPAAARPRLEAAMAARGEEYSACNHSLLAEVGALRQDPFLEELAVRSLDDEDPEVAGSAAAFLGRYGTAAAEEPLWERLTRWSEKWQGREGEFRYAPGREDDAKVWQRNLGSNLVQALATGKSWLADAGKLSRLRQLAVGSDMRRQVDSMLSDWEKGRRAVSYYRYRDQLRFRVLQYEADSLKSLEERLAQFPAGSEFTWGGGSPPADGEQVFKELGEFLAARRMRLVKPQK